MLRHSIYNLVGLGLPLVVAVFSIPVLIRELGEARFGLLTLVWAVVSYFGLFDFGLGRALTQQLAAVVAGREPARVGPLVATATALMAGLGVFAGLLMAAFAPLGVRMVQAVPDANEAINAVYAMALAMPAIILTSGFRGILEAQHAFGIVNLIRLPMGLFTFLGPLVVVLLGQPRLDWIAGVLAAGRVVACAVHAWCAWRVLPDDFGKIALQRTLLKPLCVSGSWLTMSNIISPFMGYVDRFVIGSIVSAAAVAYYTTPQEIVTKLWIVPGALTAVLFPTFAAQMVSRNDQAQQLFDKAVHWLFSLLLPATLTLTLFSREILTLWIGPEFAAQSFVLLQVFAAGIFVNCLAHVPFTLIQSAGAPRLTALIHCAELPFFLAALWWMTSSYGVLGAAIAWLLRIVADAVLMFVRCNLLLQWPCKRLINFNVTCFGVLTAIAFSGVLFQSWRVRAAWLLVFGGTAALTLLQPRSVVRARHV